MGIQSTQHITRASAIARIYEVDHCILNKDYIGLEQCSFEPDYSIADFIDSVDSDMQVAALTRSVEKWTNSMLADQLDFPFYRLSMFDNYCVENNED